MPNFLERIKRGYAAFTGKTGHRIGTRMYAAAQSSRLSGDWAPSNTSSDMELSSSLRVLRARSRALCRDVSYAKRARMLVVNNVIGSGIGMQAQVYSTRGDLNSRINDDIETQWDAWSRADSCHTGGRLHFADLERSCMAQIFEAGEVFIRKHYEAFGSSQVPFCLEIIEAERIADELTSLNGSSKTGNDIRMGIEIDRFGRPVAYYLRKRHPNEYNFGTPSTEEVERVPANQIIHLAMVDRWPQTRGEPWLHAVITTLKNMAGYTEAEILRARTQASIAGAIETPEDAASFGEEQSDGSVVMEVEPGIYKRLNPGEKLTVGPTNSPNPALDGFMRYMLREFSAGSGPSYESISRDYSQSNYSSSRLALLDDRDLWRAVQGWFIKAFREPIHREWLRQAVLSKAITSISVESYALDMAKFEAVRFRPRGWAWIDPTKEVEAFKEAVRCGFMTSQDVVAGSGGDYEELIDERQHELELEMEAGVIFDTNPANDAAQKTAQSSTQSSSQANQTDTTDAPDTSQDTPVRKVLSIAR